MKIDIVECACHDHFLRFELEDWGGDDRPCIYISAWSSGHHKDKRIPFWGRVRLAWLEFRGRLVHDEFCIYDIAQLRDLRDIVNRLLADWEVQEAKWDAERAERKG